jgi:uncharacterized protein (TIGR00369 family)
MTLSAAELQDVVGTGVFDTWLGLRIETLDETSLVVRMPVRDDIYGTRTASRLHGGAMASLIDAAGCYLLIARLGTRLSTVNMVVDFLRPAIGDVVAKATIVKLGRRICVVAVEVTGEDGKLAATGRLNVAPSDVKLGEEEVGATI